MAEPDASRIVVDAEICGGKPTIQGTRITVRNILGMFTGGYDRERILEEYPELTEEDVLAAVDYAATVIDEDRVNPRGLDHEDRGGAASGTFGPPT